MHHSLISYFQGQQIKMGVTSFNQEFASLVPADRLFKAIVLDSHNLVHKLMPQAIKSIEIIHGDGGQGTIKQTNFAEGSFIYI